MVWAAAGVACHAGVHAPAGTTLGDVEGRLQGWRLVEPTEPTWFLQLEAEPSAVPAAAELLPSGRARMRQMLLAAYDSLRKGVPGPPSSASMEEAQAQTSADVEMRARVQALVVQVVAEAHWVEPESSARLQVDLQPFVRGLLQLWPDLDRVDLWRGLRLPDDPDAPGLD